MDGLLFTICIECYYSIFIAHLEKSKIVTKRLFIDLPLTDFSNETMDRDRMSCLVKTLSDGILSINVLKLKMWPRKLAGREDAMSHKCMQPTNNEECPQWCGRWSKYRKTGAMKSCSSSSAAARELSVIVIHCSCFCTWSMYTWLETLKFNRLKIELLLGRRWLDGRMRGVGSCGAGNLCTFTIPFNGRCRAFVP